MLALFLGCENLHDVLSMSSESTMWNEEQLERRGYMNAWMYDELSDEVKLMYKRKGGRTGNQKY